MALGAISQYWNSGIGRKRDLMLCHGSVKLKAAGTLRKGRSH
jgi:hypothetical protein